MAERVDDVASRDIAPLEGVRIIDFTQAIFGAGATLVLGDLGADVIKIERVAGDFMRQDVPGGAPPWLAMNRNKRSLAIDLTDERCRELVRRLVRTGDVVIHNFRAGRIESLGFGYEAVRELNPNIIYVDMTAFGYEGPMRRWAGGDMWAQALSGAISVQGVPGDPPNMVNVPLGDQSGALIGAMAVMAGLLARGKSGLGQHIGTSLIDAVLAMQSGQIADYLVDGRLIGKGGRGWRAAFPFGPYTASDGDVLIIHGADNETWAQLCRLLGLEALLEDERYRTQEERVERRVELYPLLDAAFKKRARKEWQEIFRQGGLRCDPCLDYREMIEHPQVVANNHVWTMEHPIRGELRLVAPPIVRNGSRGVLRRPPPLVGQHTVEILHEVGVADAEMEQLRNEGLLHWQ